MTRHATTDRSPAKGDSSRKPRSRARRGPGARRAPAWRGESPLLTEPRSHTRPVDGVCRRKTFLAKSPTRPDRSSIGSSGVQIVQDDGVRVATIEVDQHGPQQCKHATETWPDGRIPERIGPGTSSNGTITEIFRQWSRQIPTDSVSEDPTSAYGVQAPCEVRV